MSQSGGGAGAGGRSRRGPPGALSRGAGLLPLGTLNWNKRAGEEFLLLFLKCTQSSHLFQHLTLEVFRVFIQRSGDVFVTRNMS